MNEDVFNKIIRSKLYNYSDPVEQSDWEDVKARMLRQQQHRRLRRWGYATCAAVAASLTLLLTVFRSPIASEPETPSFLVELREIAPSELRLKTSNTSEVYPIQLAHAFVAQPITGQAPIAEEIVPQENETDLQEAQAPREAIPLKMNPTDSPSPNSPKKPTGTNPNFIPEEDFRPNRLHKKWITAANFSYQGAINGNYLFTPSSYSTQWETPLSLASGDPQNPQIPEYMASQFDLDRVNTMSMQFSTPISAGINVQKEFNKWLSIGASVTYTLLRGEYQVATADKNYIVDQSTHYLGIPLSVYFHAVNTSWLSVYAVLGGSVDKALNDHYQYTLNDVKSTQNCAVPGFQMSVFGGVGVEYKVSELLGIYIEPSVSHYFDNNQPTSIRSIQPTQFKMELGVRFRI